ncbi:VQ motif-containing protein 10 [Ricinus communis]|uniref:VQ domain-containing protein n=1 Tax=Ricinus communis TaxID=3988 RepID=B9S108_RICCO|nr:VQ motif-containing protein 10 [Ricinus communis]EEF42650.1 conserved hypothetical protein [Ricinus communis]|eukprot:XP_002519677.1 VQ motif-containing protein 10 [Ricinus communis]
MASAKSEDVKVVIIDTQYILTDPLSFKSVVQSLTGKDSCVSWVQESSFSTGAKRKREPEGNNGELEYYSGNGGKGDLFGGGSDWMLSKGLSFEDLDRLISEMPPMEERYQLLAQSNLV